MSRKAWILVALLAVAGVALRVAAWLWGRSLDGDELSLYLNLRALDGLDLVATRLDATAATQAGPPAFLWVLDRFAEAMPPGDVSERWLRLATMLSGALAVVAAAPAAWLVARRARWEAWPVVVLVVGATALSEKLVTVAQRLKQYGGDMLAGYVLIAVVMLVDGRGPWTRRLVPAGAAGVLAWWSQPMMLVYPAYFALDALLSRRRRHWPSLVVSAALAAAMMVPVYLFARAQRDPFLTGFWQPQFAPWGEPWRVPVWLVGEWLALAEYLLKPPGVLLVPLAIVGGIALRRRRWVAALLAAPLAATVGGLLHVYPLAPNRVSLYVAPGVFLLAGLGAAALVEGRLPRRRPELRPVTLALLVVALVVAGGRSVLETARRPPDAGPAFEASLADGRPVVVFGEELGWHAAAYEPAEPPEAVWYRDADNAMPAGEVVVAIGPKPGSDAADLRRFRQALPAGAEVVEERRVAAGGAIAVVRTGTTSDSAATVPPD